MSAGTPSAAPLLEVRDLSVSFFTHVGEVKAIRGVDFHVRPGRPSASSASPEAGRA